MSKTIVNPFDEETIPESLDTFGNLGKNDPAPFWLFQGVCAAWGIDHSRSQLDLITVSENATFVLLIDGVRRGVVRVSQPGYVGGPAAVASEISWLNALHEIDGINLINPVPTVRGGFVTTIHDNEGTGWMAISTQYVDGTVLEDLDNPAPYYETIGRWAALLHEHSRHWQPPYGFTRFNWDISNMVGLSPRWGRWEDADLSERQKALCEQALHKALDVVLNVPRNHRTWGLIHADLRPSNIIRDDEGKLTVIDFDDAGYSWFLYDYAASLSFIEHEDYAPELAQSWVRGYESIEGRFSNEEIEIMSALSMIRRLQMLGWTTTHRLDALPRDLAVQQLPGSLECAQRYLKNQRWLLA